MIFLYVDKAGKGHADCMTTHQFVTMAKMEKGEKENYTVLDGDFVMHPDNNGFPDYMFTRKPDNWTDDDSLKFDGFVRDGKLPRVRITDENGTVSYDEDDSEVVWAVKLLIRVRKLRFAIWLTSEKRASMYCRKYGHRIHPAAWGALQDALGIQIIF